jgi:hypothetical protein
MEERLVGDKDDVTAVSDPAGAEIRAAMMG